MPVNASFGTVEYRENGVIAVPLTFAESVIAPSKSIVQFGTVSGDDLSGIVYRLVGSGTAFTVVITVPPERKGELRLSMLGSVLKVGTGVWDTVTATAVTVAYGTIVPRIVDVDVPASYALGSPVDIMIGYNIVVTGWNANNTITDPGIFELEGANLGTSSAYKWVGSPSQPDFEVLRGMMPNIRDEDDDQYNATENNEALRTLGWEPLDPPPGGNPTPGMNGFDNSDPPIWHGESGQYFLIRFSDPQQAGTFNLRERVGIVRGPVKRVFV